MATVVPLAGRYELREVVEDDTVKQTWAAYDLQLDRDVTIELVTARDLELQTRFLTRARLLAGENHPNLLTVYDTGREAGRPYAVLEPLVGPTLADHLQNGPSFSLAQIVDLGISLCQTTAAALQRELEVEPLRAEDVLLREGNHVKLANLLLRAPSMAADLDPPDPGDMTERTLVKTIAMLLVALTQPPGTPMPATIERAGNLPVSLPGMLRTIVLAAVATPGASIRTLAELRQALVDYRGTAISSTRSFAPVTRSTLTDGGAPALPLTRAIPGATGLRGSPVSGGRLGGLPSRSRRASPWGAIVVLALVVALIGGAVVFALWLGGIGNVRSVANTGGGITVANLLTPQPRGNDIKQYYPGYTPTPTPNVATPTPSPVPTFSTQVTTRVAALSSSTTVTGAHATETAIAKGTIDPTLVAALTPSATPTATATMTATPTIAPTATPARSPTPLPTDTPLPPPTAAVPDVVGRSVADATQILSDAGFTVTRSPNQASTSVPAGQVLAENPPAATLAPLGSAIALTASSGPPTVQVPKVVGTTAQNAAATLTNAGFQVQQSQTPSASVSAGTVIAQSPAPGAAAQPGTTVSLTVSAGNEIAVPRVIGLPEAQAQAAIQQAGFATTYPNNSGHDPSVQVGQVESQTPAAGTLVPPGTTIYINVRVS